MKTYEDILDEMKSAYFEKTGENVMLYSDLGARFQAVASELLSLYHYADFTLRQAFPQSAVGDYLDRHAALRGLERKASAKARGRLEFFIYEEGEKDITVPQGTVCSAQGKPHLQYITLEDTVIEAGTLSADAPAEAMEAGAQYNVKSGEITNMVTYIQGVDGVTNDDPFEQGEDAESDSALRKRLTDAFRSVNSGVSLACYKNEILKLDGVLKCNVTYDGDVKVCLKTLGNQLTEELSTKISRIIFAASIMDKYVRVSLVREVPYTLRVNITAEQGRQAEVLSQAEKTVGEFIKENDIGQSVDLMTLTGRLYAVPGVKRVTCASQEAAQNIVYCGADELLVAGSCEVECYE